MIPVPGMASSRSTMRAPPPPVEVRKAIQNFDKALRHEDLVFRELPEPDQAVAAAKRKFD